MASRFDQIMAQYSGGALAPAALPIIADEKKAEVTSTAAQKKEQMAAPSAEEMYLISAARRNGNANTTQGTVGDDLRRLDAWEFYNNYGSRAGSILGEAASQANAYLQDRTAFRTTKEAADDITSGVVSGFANSVLGIGALGLGLVNKDAGVWASRELQELNEYHQGEQSAGLNARRRALNADNTLDYADNEAKYIDEVKTDGAFVASLKRIGRDAWDAGANMLADPTLTSDLTANAVGSLLAGGPIAGGLKKVGKAVLQTAVTRGVIAEGGAVASRITAAGSRASMPATIGAMEGGAAYQQASAEAYALVADRTDLTEDQKTEIANNAGIRAAQIQAPIGAITGTLTSRFEASPFRVSGIRSTASNILRETVEEGIQGGSGQLATNVGIRDFVDPNRDIVAGVGEQVGLGAIGGFAAGGAVQTPGAVLRTAVNGAKLTGRAAMAAAGSVMGAVDVRNQKVLDEVASASPVSAPRMDDLHAKTVAAAPVVQAEAVASVQADTKLTPTEKTETTSYIDNLFNNVKFDDTEADNQIPIIGNVIRGSMDRFDAMRRVSDLASDENAQPSDRLAAGLYLLDTIRNYQGMIEQVPEAIEKLDDNDPALDQVRAFEDVLLNIQSHPRIKEAIQAAVQFDQAIKAGDLNPETPEGQQNIQTAVQLASLVPEKSNPDVNDQILLHAEQGKIELSPQDQGILKAATALHRAEEQHDARVKELGLSNSQIISKQIQDDTSNPDTLHKSAIAHMEAVFGAMKSGNTPLASRRLQHFLNFAQSMQNKVAALNENLEAGDGSDQNATFYQAYNPRTGKFFKTTTPVFLKGTSVGSVKLAQQIYADAAAVGWLANEVAAAFPELNIKSIDLVELNEAMRIPAREAARDYRISLRDNTKNIESQTSDVKADRDEDDRQIELPLVQPKKDEAAPTQEAPAPVEPDLDFEREARQEKADRRAEVQATPADTNDDMKIRPEDALSTSQNIAQPVEENVPDQVEIVDENNRTESEVLPQVSAIDQAYPNLLGELFKDSFKLPNSEAPISRLAVRPDESPLDVLGKALSSVSKFRDFVGKESGSQLTEPVAKAYKKYLTVGGYLSNQMDIQLSAALDKVTKGKTLREFIKRGGEAARFIQNRALNITELVDGNIEYSRELKENAIIAGLQWMLTADQRARDLSDEDVAKILRIPVTSVTDEQIAQFNQGLYFDGVVSDLANAITRYWGVQSNNSAPIGLTKGIPEGVAKELLRAMDEAGLIEIISFKENNKTYNQVRLLGPEKMGETYEELMKFPSAIEQAVAVDPEEVLFIGSPPAKVARTQLRNPLVKLTKQQTDMIEAEQATKHYINQPMVDFIQDLGEDAAVELFGYGDLSKQAMNKNHRQSLESINLTVRSAVRAIQNTYAAVQNKALVDGVAADQMPIHYAYEFTSVNRLQMLGKHNPQANKLTREAILPTRSTLDLTNDDNMDRFMLGVAQAWGLKVHKQPRARSVEQARELAEGQYAPVIQVLRNYLNGVQVDLSENIPAIKQAFGNKPVSPVALHAAMEYARYLNQEDKAKFTTSLYVEADGITDGPINAMVHTARGAFSYDWLNVVRKGGLFFGQPGMTANSSSDNVDLYQYTTNYLKERMRDLKLDLLDNIPVKNQMDTLLRVMSQLLPDVGFDPQTGELRIERGVVKNPLTVTIYGAGPSGIANKVTGALIKAVYERESAKLQFLKENPKGDVALFLFGDSSSSPEEARRKYAEYNSDMATLLNNRVEKSRGELTLTEVETPQNNSMKNGSENFTLLPQQVENLQLNISQLFVTPMREAIAAAIGETDQGVLALRQATQVQSIYLQYAFKKAVDAELAKKERKSDFLSQKELQGIYDKLKHLAPFIETGTQNMLVSGSDRVNIDTASFSRSLAGDLSTPAYVFGPMNSGVSGIPFTIIGTGDGQMMQNVSTMDYAPEGTLKIFDGMNMKLSTIEEDSRKVNEAVYRGWLANPLGDVARTFSEFVRDADLNQMEDQQRTDLAFALFGPKGSEKETADIVEAIQALDAQFQQIATEAQARKNVLARVQLTVDHMASAEASYDSEGIDLSGLSDDQVIARLNELYAEELAKLMTNPKPSENITRDIADIGVISADDLIKFVRKLNVPEEQKTLMLEAARALRGTDWNVTFGETPSDPTIRGAANFGTKTINIYSGSSETLLHEMIHASTMNLVSAYYQGNTELSTVQTEAIERIEGLMQEWLDNSDTVSDLNAATRQAFNHAQTTVLGHLGSGQKAAALNEFMAWVLSNQPLARVAQHTKVQNPVLRIVKDVLEALKTLIWGKAKAPRVSDDIYSNLRFNTSILMRTSPSVVTALNETILFQSEQFGNNDRLTRLREQFFEKVARYVNDQPNPAARLTAQYKSFVAKAQADAVQASFNAHGFPMTMQEASTFQMLVAALATEIELNPNSLTRAQELYAHVSKTITVEDFMIDPERDDPQDRFTAQERYNSILGINLTEIDEQGRSTLLPAFLALAATNDVFREVLSKMDLPKGERLPNDTLDNRLTNIASESMDRLGILMSGERRNTPSVQTAIDMLTDKLAEASWNEKDFITQITNPVGNGIDAANKWIIGQMTKLSETASDKLQNIKTNTNRKSVKAAANFGQLLAGVVNETVASDLAKSGMSLLNKTKVWAPIHELFNELVGRTSENAPVYDMIKEVRSAIQQMRQQFREHLPELIQKRFTRELEDSEWTALFNGLGRTDLASLRSGYSSAQVQELLVDPAKVSQETVAIEARILGAHKQGQLVIRKAEELARYMVNGTVPANLLRNSYAIANLFGEGNNRAVSNAEIDTNVLRDIDHLVSLYALDNLTKADRDSLASLVQDQKDGVSFILAYLEGQRQDELAGVDQGRARINHYKGYIPSVQSGASHGRTLIVANDEDFVKFRQMGYTRVADYEGSAAEQGALKKGYYFSNVSGRSVYNQGILQTVHTTVSGVDPVTGFTTAHATAGRIVDPAIVDRVTKRLRLNQKGKEPLLPVYDNDGNVSAYERSIDPDQEARLQKSTNMADMLGVWRGRQAEEMLAERFNETLIDRLHNIWDKEEITRRDEYVNIFDPKTLREDKVLTDAVRLIPRDTRAYIDRKFGDGFWVRRDMLNDALGYRAASVGDAWTGNTRFSEETQKNIRQIATGVFGIDAYKRLVQGEKLIQNVITDLRVLVVVKSVIVPFTNLVANLYQLSARGVPLANSIKGMPKKTAELNGYIKGRIRKIELEAELRASVGDAVATRRLRTEMQSIEDSWKRLSVWPLIEAGEFSSVSDVGIGKEEIDLAEGRLNTYVEKLTDKLPDQVKTAGKYLIIAKDTALFKGLQRTVEYGDFLAKSILYDDLTKRQGLSHEEALARITEEYVNYDRLSGRSRDYLENMGLIWFWNFKIRSTKIALSMIRNNPLHTMLTMLAPTPPFIGDIGNPVTDNILSIAADGRLDNSIGYGMGLRSLELNPWHNLIN